jgi:DNA-binding MarR family transcriptional regulator
MVMKDTARTNGQGLLLRERAEPVAARGRVAEDSTSHRQARRLIAQLLSLGRNMFMVDDAAAELPLRQLRVCSILSEGPRSMSSLGRELGVSLSAMTQIADRLETARLVTRHFEGTDRRVRSLQLTLRGKRIMRRREQLRVRQAFDVMQRLSPKERKTVLAALQLLLTASEPTKP